ncbi:iron complex transport system permease protein [Streptosporangium becharense]|uniref:Iron complex transport system permease protein n=1 Tax=Streptosporangium becharense TaxID=1816182 RepID=A0A7W9MFQ9_9ACTN|nr:iron chelate uptake ABC transporter family permease subunit [Streptosporangium becharense]MBB2912016.1 iron complex transport system permease protein [Streptosporangium becharense]MBB5818563.1 iron complex transport system permease protein [Streptosporangium becharense]
MSTAGVTTAASEETGEPDGTRPRRTGRPAVLAAGLVAGVALLVLLALVSIAVGSRSVPLSTVLDALLAPDGSSDHTVVRDLRVPRTLIGIGVGAALGLAGALMQSLTRNPLADPGLLGVNHGAAFGVTLALGLFGLSDPSVYVWFAFAGAAVTAALAYALGSAGRSGASPVRLTLAGVALGMVFQAASSAILRIDSATFDRMRFWLTGSLAGVTPDVALRLAPFLAVGLVLGLLLARPLNTLALGDEAGRALGVGVARTRGLTAVAVTLLCGAATAAAGPLWFVGLAVPHAVRAFTGPDQRWMLPYTVVLAPAVLLASDVAGRVIAAPGEVQVGIMCAVLGAPVFILLARRRRLAAL